MTENISRSLGSGPVTFSAPCRIDMGGTLDISSLYYPMARLKPCTFNIALDLRTRVRISPYKPGRIRVASKGFQSAEFCSDQAPFSHGLGLIFAIAACFGIDGIDIDIESASPPKSALGGSSVAAVALVAAFLQLEKAAGRPEPDRCEMAVLAHGIEQGIAGVPCGMQDHLAAAYGGINVWNWRLDQGRLAWEQLPLDLPENGRALDANILVAYCGVPHESKDVNGTWIRRFLKGLDRPLWQKIVENTRKFVHALANQDLMAAADAMNREVEIRRQITPEVVDDVGAALLGAARKENCGARFAGAGGGGCLWALGSEKAICLLRPRWEAIVSRHPDGAILYAGVDTEGVRQEPG